MRLPLLRLTGLLLAATVVSGQTTVEPSAPALSPLCQNAFIHAVNVLAEDGSAAVSPAATDAAVPGGSTHLDYVVQRCPNLAEWLAGASFYAEVLRGADPLAFLEARCSDPESGLAQYALCVSLVQALATPPPTPVPVPTLAPGASPIPSPDPLDAFGAGPPPTPRTSAPGANAGNADVPDGRVAVPGASRVHYFHVRGASLDQLMRSVTRQARQFCGSGDSIACVVPQAWRFNTQTQLDPDTGSCTIAGLDATVGYVAHIPRWTAPRRVPASLAWWWRQVVTRAGWQQVQHVRILEDHLAVLHDEVVGQPCSEFDRLLDEWNASLDQAQAAFARLDDPRQEQASQEWLRQAGGG